MNRRDEIMASIQQSLPRLDCPSPQMARFDDSPHQPLLGVFTDNLQRMGGVLRRSPLTGDPMLPVRDSIAGANVICSVVPEITGTLDITGVVAPRALADVDFAIVRASFAVAETGSVLLSDADLYVDALAYLAKHLIVLLDPADIVLDLRRAHRRTDFHERRNPIFHTGPSATVDIEGSMIDGAYGVRSLAVLLVARTGNKPCQ
jgi:L-lactate dehydrogenase complex protein LldG